MITSHFLNGKSGFGCAKHVAGMIGIVLAFGVSTTASRGADKALSPAEQDEAVVQDPDYKLIAEAVDKNHQEARLEPAQRLVSKYPQSAEALRWLYHATPSVDPTKDALPMLKKVMALRPDYLPSLIDYANLMEAQGHFKEAKETYLKALKIDGHDYKVLSDAGNFYQQRGDKDEALKLHQRTEKALSGTSPYEHIVEWRKNYIWHGLGWQYLDLGMPEKGANACEQALNLAPDDRFAWFVLGECRLALKQYAAAVDAYRHATKLAPFDEPSWLGMGNAYYKLHQLPEAEDALRHAAGILPAPKDEPEGTVQKDMPSKGPHYALDRSLDGLGHIYYETKRYEDAENAFTQALKVDESSAQLWNGLGWSQLQQKKHEEALAAFQKATTLKADYVDSWFGMGNALHGLDKIAEAAEAYRKAAKYGPNDAMNWAYLGSAYDKLQKRDEAIAAYKKTLKLKPDFQGVKDALEADLAAQKKK